MLQKKNEGILFSAEIRVVGSYTDRLLMKYTFANNITKLQLERGTPVWKALLWINVVRW